MVPETRLALMLKLSQIYIYPVKSLAGIAVPSSAVTDRGLQHDRRWMLVDEKNKFITQRQYPEMARLHPALSENALLVRDAENPAYQIEIPFELAEAELENVRVWKAKVAAKSAGRESAEWFSDRLGRPCKLVFMPDSSRRPVDASSGIKPTGKITSFSDAYPFLMLGEASLDDLNSRLDESVSILRFRPNLVFSGGYPYQEDEFNDFIINGISFTGLENCARCNVPNINPETAEVSKDNQPIKTLAAYRTVDRKILLGRDLIHAGTGKVSVGDEIVLS